MCKFGRLTLQSTRKTWLLKLKKVPKSFKKTNKYFSFSSLKVQAPVRLSTVIVLIFTGTFWSIKTNVVP